MLIGLTRSSYYYQRTTPDPQDEGLMRLLDAQYTETPFYGVPRMTECLRRLGHRVGPKRVRRLLRAMGLEAVYPKPNLSKPAPGHRDHVCAHAARLSVSDGGDGLVGPVRAVVEVVADARDGLLSGGPRRGAR